MMTIADVEQVQHRLQTDSRPVDFGRTRHQRAKSHARELLAWLLDSEWPIGARVLTATEMREVYAEMCIDTELHPRPWNPIARELSLLIRQPGRPAKTYEWRLDDQQRRRRVRVYELPLNGPDKIEPVPNKKYFGETE